MTAATAIFAKSNLKPAEIYLRICQLRFLTCIAHMDPSCLPRQVINSQANAKNGKDGITTKAWIECLKNPDTTELIEENLGFKHGSFKRGKKGKRRKENTKLVVV